MIEVRRSAIVRHTPQRMFDLVNDVEAYPSRFAWCADARVLAREGDTLTARLDLRFAGFTHGFTTRNTLRAPESIRLDLVEGPLRALAGEWTFLALGSDGCKVGLALDFDHAGIAAPALRLGFRGLADRLVDDFCRVARASHG
jgi:ribosome-associated toxin RatA of RatAB toxin-antitoxin module